MERRSPVTATEVLDDLACRYIINEPQEELVSFERVLFLIEQVGKGQGK